jgi:hypothetical protein
MVSLLDSRGICLERCWALLVCEVLYWVRFRMRSDV